ncbi:G-type lectin S-receptor-like serine/threonine-protein kinase CES101 isoform X2 [Vigna radiata var. radiata]|uniref:Receptor-like serine/threonine-protein kinase n=1 Tax=Vigna radiata var. radiata TaxID=3916 RepID=A0A3Q0EUC6_VIGRR|nr:G-type lectin S-receptor-like serine/threonine-protein kinase CES101 isoform X2 [Vigna radiata var. radiata]
MVFTLSNRVLCFIIITFTCFLQLAKPSNLREDTLLQGHPLAATDRLISPSSLYTLRFFQLDDGSEASTKFYLGISANKYYYYVWLANRDNPIHDDPGVLTIDEYGNLKIVSSTTTMMLYSVEAESNKSVRASLLDTGNFVLHELNLDGSVKRVLWQSFDYPTDTILPGMKLGYDKHSGHKWSLTARRSYKTLWSGSFSLSLDPKINQLITRWRGDIIWASGEWRNGSFSNLISSSLDREKFNFTFFSNESVTYFEYSPVSGYLIMGPLGIINATGVSYSCVGSEIVPGCTMPQPPKCREDGDLYLPSWNSFGAMSRKGYIFDERENMTISDCWMRCLKNCSCEAYTYAFKDATGCEIWSRYTSHFVESNSGVGRPIFFFLSETKASKKRRIWIASAAVGVLLLILSFIASFIMFGRKQKQRVENRKKRTNVFSDIGENTEISNACDEGREEWNEKRTGSDTHKFDFITILQATDNFSLANKIGEGGFGPVYKGKLANGEEIAIKRLSKSSGQGLVEFRNEAMVIVKLQHTNLVRLLGFCIDREERILVYEYMANKSLNLYLFDANKRSVLDWKIRYKIIEGIAQGLVYLHQYSRLKVIHRDLKSSNILLDNELNPKISDFGMARILKWTILEEKTNRVVGTYGYMPPEYALSGVISTKTDVYSFGVLLLEIVTGKKNISEDFSLNLIGYAWQLWNEGEALKLIDKMVNGSCHQIQVIRCIHIGLLCTQDKAKDRPSMLEVISFISNENCELPSPIQPPLYTIKTLKETDQHKYYSNNDITMSIISAR